MKFTPVESSMMTGVFYDELRKRLFIRFKNDTVYQYFNVPKVEVDDMLTAESAGKYFHKNIKPIYGFAFAGMAWPESVFDGDDK